MTVEVWTLFMRACERVPEEGRTKSQLPAKWKLEQKESGDRGAIIAAPALEVESKVKKTSISDALVSTVEDYRYEGNASIKLYVGMCQLSES